MGKKIAKKRVFKELKVPDKKNYSKNKKVKVKKIKSQDLVKVPLNDYQGPGVEINVTKSCFPLDDQNNINIVENPKNSFVEEVVKPDITQKNSTVEKESINLEIVKVGENKSSLNQGLNCFSEFHKNPGEQFQCRELYNEKKDINNSFESSTNTLLVLDDFKRTTISQISNLEKNLNNVIQRPQECIYTQNQEFSSKRSLNDNCSLSEEKIVEITNLDASDSQLYEIEVEDSKESTKATCEMKGKNEKFGIAVWIDDSKLLTDLTYINRLVVNVGNTLFGCKQRK